jgi:hypothetical protein
MSKAAGKKKRYTKPALMKRGTLRDLTASAASVSTRIIVKS